MGVNLISETGTAIAGPLVSLVQSAIETIPGIVAAIAVLILGYIIALMVGYIAKSAVYKLSSLKKYVKDSSVCKVCGTLDLAEFTGVIIKWYVFILFLPAVAKLIRLEPLSDFLQKVSLWVPNLIIAVIIAFVGLLGAEYVAMKIQGTKSRTSNLIASASKIIIVVFVSIIALQQVGIDVSIAESSVLIILAGVMLGLGLSFGLGGVDEAKDVIKRIKKNL